MSDLTVVRCEVWALSRLELSCDVSDLTVASHVTCERIIN